MSFHSIQQQVEELFDSAEHPNITYKDDNDFTYLTKTRTFPIAPASTTIQIIKDVLEAIMYVSSHLLIYKPCQVFKEHVVEKNGRWGLCNIICYRDPKQSSNFNPNRYYPLDYYEHEDEDSQLTWSLGRMWFQMLTDSRLPPIKNLTSQEITNIIDSSGINDGRILGLLKGVLVVEKSKRKSLSSLIESGLFQYEQQSKIYSKIIKSQFESKIWSTKQISEIKKQSKPINPYEQQLFKRDFKEAIIVASFLQKVKQTVHNRFQNNEDNKETDFSCYLIDYISYVRLNNLKRKVEKEHFMLVLLYDKSDYTLFLEKLLQLEGRIDKKRKQKKFDKFRTRFPILFKSPEDLTEQEYREHLYERFKQYISHYAKYLKKQRNLDDNTKDYKNYVILVNLLLARTLNYVFGNCRKFIFKDFISDEIFNLQNVLRNIEKCKDVVKLARIEKKIVDIYFVSKGQEK